MISKEIKIENRKDYNLMSAVASKCDKRKHNSNKRRWGISHTRSEIIFQRCRVYLKKQGIFRKSKYRCNYKTRKIGVIKNLLV